MALIIVSIGPVSTVTGSVMLGSLPSDCGDYTYYIENTQLGVQPPPPSTSSTSHLLQVTRCATAVQWQSQADTHTMELGNSNVNVMGVVKDTIHMLRSVMYVHTHTKAVLHGYLNRQVNFKHDLWKAPMEHPS